MEGNTQIIKMGTYSKLFRPFSLAAGLLVLACTGSAQVPDLLNAFDAGSRASGAGGAFTGASADSFSTLANPAGLGYVDRAQVQYSQRNLPTTANKASGSFDNPSLSGSSDKGSTRYSHIGIVIPATQLKRGAVGNIGFTYDLGGYLEDSITATSNLSYGTGFFIKGFTQDRKVTQDFYTFSYGKSTRGGAMAYGVGLTIVNQKLDFKQTGQLVDGNGQDVGGGQDVITFPDVNTNGTGIGLVAGLQYTPPKDPNGSYWASLRTPISISSAGSDSANLKRIPGRVTLGAAKRMSSPLKRADDYLVIAAQLQSFFGGSTNRYFDQGQGTAFGVGLEYMLSTSSYKIPVRLGYQHVGSTGFSDRKGITYGIGFSPADQKYSIDLNYFRPSNGAADFALTATYRF